MRFISWFAGIGGFDLALTRDGMTCVGAYGNAVAVLVVEWIGWRLVQGVSNT